jgi:hypothetical protein
VYFDTSSGTPEPRQGAVEITADRAAVINNVIGTTSTGFSYACFKDVTRLVREFTPSPTGHTNKPGIADYTVGGVDGTQGNDSLPGDGYQLAHAGWSLIIVYSGPQTLGHQLYLFDTFSFCDDYADIDFDRDGNPGGDISGFLVPEPIDDNKDGIPDESFAAKMTVMVGEGDDFIASDGSYPGDFLAFNAPETYRTAPNIPARDTPNQYKLWDGTLSVLHSGSNTSTYPNNSWNGMSAIKRKTGGVWQWTSLMNADGVDIDNFYVPWGSPASSGLLKPGDTSAHIDLCTAQDNWNLVYVIISFRSKAKTGGALTYLIRQ